MRTVWAVIVVSLIVAANVATAGAAPAVATFNSAEADLSPSGNGGGSATLTATNTTTEPRAVVARVDNAASPACRVTVEPSTLPAFVPTKLTLTLSAPCGVSSAPVVVSVAVEGQSAAPVVLTPAVAQRLDWSVLWVWFAAALVGAAVLMVAVYVVAGTKLHGDDRLSFLAPLPSLDDSWSFKDSWVTNITVIAGLLTGIFGSADVVKAILGTDADEAIAMATVGAAISVALIGAAGVLVLAIKNPVSSAMSVGGVLIGSAFALGAAGGQIGVVYETARRLDLGIGDVALLVILVVALAILVGYGFVSVLGVILTGRPKPPAVMSQTLVAAAMQALATSGEPVNQANVAAMLARVAGQPDDADKTLWKSIPPAPAPLVVELAAPTQRRSAALP